MQVEVIQMEILLSLQIEPLDEGGYLATSEDFHGLLAQGRTVAETMEIAQDVARKLVESYLEHGDPLPPKIADALKQQRMRRSTVQVPIVVVSE
jgi:predicted RNase H-like HicB family nuclease